MSADLRPYQDRAVNVTASYYARHPAGSLLLVLPPAAGKTLIGARVVRTMVYEMSLRGLVIAHRREIINSIHEKLVKDGVPSEAIGVVMAGDPRENDAAPIQVASIDTLRARGLLPAADFVWLDESHLDAAEHRAAIIAHYRAAGAFILGTTATPERLDGKGFSDIYEHLEIGAQPSELLKGEFITRPALWGVPAELMPRISGRKRGGDLTEKEADRAVNQPRLIGNVVKHWKKHARGLKTLVFAASIKHSLALVERFRKAGVAAEHLDGSMPERERKRILENLRSGRTKVVCSRDLLTTGVDLPMVRCVVAARPTLSVALHIQMCGRVFRLFEDKGAMVGSVILDHAGNCTRPGLGDPQADRPWTRDGLPKGTGDAPMKTCEVCGAMCPTGCAECPEGHPFDMTREMGEDDSAELVDMLEARRAKEETEVRAVVLREGIPATEAVIQRLVELRLGRAA